MRRHALLAMLACSGCSGGTAAIQQGEWQSMTALEGPSGATVRSSSNCVRGDDAANPARILLAGAIGQCQIAESRFEGGNLSVRATCTGRDPLANPMNPSSVTLQVVLEGRYTETNVDARITATEGEGPDARRMTGTLTSNHKGACSG